MKWSRYPVTSGGGVSFRAPIPANRYVSDGDAVDVPIYSVDPRYATNRRGRRLTRVVWHLHENGRMIGRPFNSARLAKSFAAALNALGDDPRARAAFIRDGGEWCFEKEVEWRRERDERRFAQYEREER